MVNDNDALAEAVDTLADAGISFIVTGEGRYGSMWQFILTKEDALEYCRDPATVMARHHGIGRDQFIAWFDSDRSVICSARTTQGRRCRNPVRGGYQDCGPREWVELQGGYCPVHGG